MPKPSSAPDPLLTLKQAAQRLSVHTTTLRRWADNGAIPVVVTPGGHRRFPRSAVEALATQRGGPEAGQQLVSAWAEQALSHTRAEIDEHREERWLSAMDEAEREIGRAHV